MNGRQKIIVSLTSFPQAIPYAIQSIQSVLDGSVLPDKIVLYLTASQFADCGIPSELERLAERNPIFEVRTYGEDIRSYTKLIPALIDFPDDIIVTIDDDILYHADMLRDLLRLHKRLPQAIVAHRVRRVVLDAPYKKWRKYRWYDFLFRRYIFDRHAMQTGVGGVLYPPHSLDEKMLDASLFMDMAPINDDVWFWAAAVSRGTYVVPLRKGCRRPFEIGKPGSISLKSVNLKPGDDRNRKALEKILEHYPEIRKKL